MNKILLIAATAALALASPAQAETALETAVQRGENYWEAIPCETHFGIQFSEAKSGNTIEAGYKEMGFAVFSTCQINLSQGEWPDEDARIRDWPELCHATTHELGHLILGPTYYASTDPSNPAHAASPTNTMYFSETDVYPSTCFPAVFRLEDGTHVKWTYKHHKLIYSEKECKHWEVIEETEANKTLQTPSQARVVD